MALLLRKQGITRVRPLLGGFDAWREKGYPVEKQLVHLHGEEATKQAGVGM